MKVVLILTALMSVQCLFAEDAQMKNVLVVIAGLVQNDGTSGNKVDAMSSASKSDKNKLYAHTTSEIAYQMQKYLEAKNCKVDVVSTESPVDLNAYDLVIIGSGIYGMRPHGSIKPFIKSNKLLLAKKKTALFVVCGTLCSYSEKTRNKALKFADKMVFGLSPISKTVFSGTVKDFGGFGNWLGKKIFQTYPVGDYRDWNVIKDWTIALLANR